MTVFIALLRAVNVGGTGKLAMRDLKLICERAGFKRVQTYIASGNVVFSSGKTEARVKAALESALAAHAGKPVGALVRTAVEMQSVLAHNPFRDMQPSRTVAIFLDAPPPSDAVSGAVGQQTELIAPGQRELYVFYDKDIASSKLRIPAAKTGTARNMNTVAKLVDIATGLSEYRD
ncbi:DUF1697 domain-containing protein [Rhodoferax sediminis]|jgi:uncharacterized protein (DUF1697 family)|uniref:DUF1697 domain-containing protein n=1 Tax=Rhodoferax sediminis TaxID=2509614 RepID=A0A515D892_9BURK|nr:DUF1697 domain-containing protein [Rhodoferax sediminis]QDL36629.1 DUF1697 domain-containing protein [Rhodoferax sediminis]